MAVFSARIESVQKNKISFNVTVEFDKDSVLFDTITFQNVNPLESVYEAIDNRIQMYIKVDETDTTGFIGDVVFTPEEVAEKADRKLWFEKYAKYVSALRAIENKILAEDDPDTATLLADLKSTYKPEYGIF